MSSYFTLILFFVSSGQVLLIMSVDLCFYCGKPANFYLKNGKPCCVEKWQGCPAQKSKATHNRKGKGSNILYESCLENRVCDYGCGTRAKYLFVIVGKYCCEHRPQMCPNVRNKITTSNTGLKRTDTFKEKMVAVHRNRSKEWHQKIKEHLNKINAIPMSEATKRKISESVTREKNGFYGKSHTDKTKEMLSAKHKGSIPWNKGKSGLQTSWNEGKTAHDDSRILSRENHPRWKGGISTEPYCCEFTTPLKEFIKHRDGYRCLNPECCKTKSLLHVHHIDYNKKNCEHTNLITVCISCNSKANTDREWHESWYKAIIYRRYGMKG